MRKKESVDLKEDMRMDEPSFGAELCKRCKSYGVVDCPKFLKEDERDEKDTDII